jgi:AraC-like DNA-binding protein
MKPIASSEYQSRAGSFSGIDVIARELGQPLLPMLQRFGLSLELIADPEQLISFNAFCQLLEACAKDWNCPNFGLRLGNLQNLNVLGPVGLVARLSGSVGAALSSLQSSLMLHSTGIVVTLDSGDVAQRRPAAISFSPKPGAHFGRQIVELSICASRNVVAMVSGNPEFRPLRVGFAHTEPTETAYAQKLFGCPVTYGESENYFSFDAEILGQSTAIRDAAYEPIIRAYLEQMRGKLEPDIVETTRVLIGKLLSSGRCTRDSVAECLHLHPRTLQRRLGEKGLTFAQIMDDYRKHLALDLVQRPSMPLAQVAIALGFSDQSTFNQAFRRWTETTPTAYRNSLSGT